MQVYDLQVTTMNLIWKIQILSARDSDKEYHILKEKTAKNEQKQVKTDFSLNKQGLLFHKNKLYIPNIP